MGAARRWRQSQAVIERDGRRITEENGVTCAGRDEWLAVSRPGGTRQYSVRCNGKYLMCECPYYERHRARCKRRRPCSLR